MITATSGHLFYVDGEWKGEISSGIATIADTVVEMMAVPNASLKGGL